VFLGRNRLLAIEMRAICLGDKDVKAPGVEADRKRRRGVGVFSMMVWICISRWARRTPVSMW
jgi:hypothetical protein